MSIGPARRATGESDWGTTGPSSSWSACVNVQSSSIYRNIYTYIYMFIQLHVSSGDQPGEGPAEGPAVAASFESSHVGYVYIFLFSVTRRLNTGSG